MSEADPVDRRKEQYEVLDTLAEGRDDTTPVGEVLAKLRDIRRMVADERNQNRFFRDAEM